MNETGEIPDTPEDEPDASDELAGKLIDAWCADKGKKIPWAKAVQIVAIVTKQSDAERDRLLRMGDDEDGKCEMCGRQDFNAAPAPISDLAMMLRRMIWQIRKRDVNDDSLSVLAGKADDLLRIFRLQGSPLHDDKAAGDA